MGRAAGNAGPSRPGPNARPPGRTGWWLGLLLAASLTPASGVRAQSADSSSSASSPTPGSKSDGKEATDGDVLTRSNLLGSVGRLRPFLDRYGIAFGLSESFEVLGNPTGGVRRGAIAEGLAQVSLGADLSKTFGWQGATFNVSAYQIHGRGLTALNLMNLNVASSIEADPSTRLNELWIQQQFWDGRLDVKVGQQSADYEFITSEYEDLFINSGFGWPTLPAIDLPSGGPAYPLPTPGIGPRARPTDQLTRLLGLFDGNPAGPGTGDPQLRNASGTTFDLSGGAFVIGEAQYAVNKEHGATGLPATAKLGAWYNTNRFADPFANGVNAPVPDPTAGGPGTRQGDWSVYGTLDALVYRPDPDGDGGLAVTARAMGAPGDRSLVDAFIQGGVTYKGVFGRDGDTVGVGAEYTRISPRASAGDAATAEFTGAFYPVRSEETVVEATYQAQVTPWLMVQPDFQYVIRPGGGLPDPDRPGRVIGDAAVFGLRSTVTF